MATASVLIIDDDENVQRTLAGALAPSYGVHVAASGEDGPELFERTHHDVVLLDLMLPQMSGMAVLRALKELRADQPVIVMTAYAEVHSAVLAIKLGALDYVQKPVDPSSILRELAQIAARATRRTIPIDVNVIGASPEMKRVWRLVERFGPTDIPILLQGETGTGKGLFAEAIHRVSKRTQGPFVAIDCATIPGDLAESELFGYEDGAFTGAGRKKRGRGGVGQEKRPSSPPSCHPGARHAGQAADAHRTTGVRSARHAHVAADADRYARHQRDQRAAASGR
jgi:two-component system, NtrC family, response regulator AtoC